MVNYACDFSQSESGKYFEWTIRRIKQIEEGVIQPRPQGFSLGWVLSTLEKKKKCTAERVEMISCKIVSAVRTILDPPKFLHPVPNHTSLTKR